MTKTTVGKIGGKDIVHIMLESQEEIRNSGLPGGLYHYWEIDGQQHFSPQVIVNMVQSAVLDGTFDPAKIIQPEEVKRIHKDLVAKQKEQILGHYEKIRDQYVRIKAPPEVLRHIDGIIDNHRKFNMAPSLDGQFRPNLAEATAILGNEAINKFYTEAEQGIYFGDR